MMAENCKMLRDYRIYSYACKNDPARGKDIRIETVHCIHTMRLHPPVSSAILEVLRDIRCRQSPTQNVFDPQTHKQGADVRNCNVQNGKADDVASVAASCAGRQCA